MYHLGLLRTSLGSLELEVATTCKSRDRATNRIIALGVTAH